MSRIVAAEMLSAVAVTYPCRCADAVVLAIVMCSMRKTGSSVCSPCVVRVDADAQPGRAAKRVCFNSPIEEIRVMSPADIEPPAAAIDLEVICLASPVFILLSPTQLYDFEQHICRCPV